MRRGKFFGKTRKQMEEKTPSSSTLWSRGILEGIVESIVIGGVFGFLDRAYPLGEQFSAEGVMVAALVIVWVGFAVTKLHGVEKKIDFTDRWAYLFGSTIVGLLLLFPSPYAGFTVVVWGSSIVFGSWLKMVSIESKRPKRHF